MTALIVYESMFGNTKRIALAIAEGIATKLPVETIEVSDAPEEIGGDIALLVVGGPTHVHGMSSPRTRKSAAERADGPLVSQRIGIREWLDNARAEVFDIHAAAFDTRVNGMAMFTGSAAKGYEKGLRSAGFRVDWPPQSFLVSSSTPPSEDALLAGQIEEARAWGEAIASKVTPGG